MARRIVVLVLISLLLIVSKGYAVQNTKEISLQFSYEPSEIQQSFVLPNGNLLFDYDTKNTSAFWKDLGREDVLKHVTEVLDPSGQSLMCFQDGGDILPEEADRYLIQYAIYPDRLVREYYINASMETYYMNVWSHDGDFIDNPMDPIQQTQEDARYVFSMYPYLLELSKTGLSSQKNASLHQVIDLAEVQLPYVGGSRTTACDYNSFYLLYSENDSIRLLRYDHSTKQVSSYATNLDTDSGIMVINGSTLVFLSANVQEGKIVYSVFSSSYLERQDGQFLFIKQAGFDAPAHQVIDELFFVDNHLCCIGENENGKSFIGRIDGGQLFTEAVLNERLRLVNHDAGLLWFLAENKPGTNCRFFTIQDNDYQSFLTSFVHAQ